MTNLKMRQGNANGQDKVLKINPRQRNDGIVNLLSIAIM
jgi:hypothetical protein